MALWQCLCFPFCLYILFITEISTGNCKQWDLLQSEHMFGKEPENGAVIFFMDFTFRCGI